MVNRLRAKEKAARNIDTRSELHHGKRATARVDDHSKILLGCLSDLIKEFPRQEEGCFKGRRVRSGLGTVRPSGKRRARIVAKERL